MGTTTNPTKIMVYQSVGFLALIALAWFDAVFSLRSLILEDHPNLSNYGIPVLEVLLILAVWLLVATSTRRVLERVRHLEKFMRVCAWCHRIEHKGTWMPLEQFLQQSFDTPTSHGICGKCLEKEMTLRAEAEREKQTAQTQANQSS
jgi:hypothetical protein